MTELGPAEGTLSLDEIAHKLEKEMKAALDEIIDPSHDAEQLQRIARAKSNIHFIKGNHFIAPDWVSSGGSEIVDWVVSDSSIGGDDDGASVKFMYPFNVVGGDCWKYVAVMGQSAPRVKAVPDDLSDIEAERQADNADINVRDLTVKWRLDHVVKDIAYHQWTTGPAFLYSRHVVDGAKNGITLEPTVDLQEQESEFGTLTLPVEGPPKPYENGDSELVVLSVLEVQILPSTARHMGEVKFLRSQVMLSKFTLISTFPKLRKLKNDDILELDSRAATLTAASEAIDSASNASGVGKPQKRNEWPYTEDWFSPDYYEAFSDSLRDVLKQQFPRGIKVSRVGQYVCDVKHEAVTDCMAVCKTGRGPYIMANPLCSDSIPIQKAVNDFFGLGIETILRAIPRTIVNQQLFDRQAISKNEAIPGEFLFATPPPGQKMDDMLTQTTAARFSDQMTPFLQMMRTYMTDINGMRPELSGGGPPSTTFREAKMRRDQALMQLQPAADCQQEAIEDILTIGIKQRAKYGVGSISAPARSNVSGKRMDVADLAELSETGWHLEAESGVPETWAERADKLADLLKNYPPEILQLLGLTDVMNVQQIYDLLHIQGFQSPVFDQIRKMTDVISRLKTEMPVEVPGVVGPDGMQGPPVKTPSVMPEEGIDDPAFCVQFIQRWANGDDGRKTKQTNEAGYGNVKAFLDICQNMMQQAMPPDPNGGPEQGGPPPQPSSPGGQPPPPGPPPEQPQLPPPPPMGGEPAGLIQ